MAESIASWVLPEAESEMELMSNGVFIRDWPLDQYLRKGGEGRAGQRQKENFGTDTAIAPTGSACAGMIPGAVSSAGWSWLIFTPPS